MSARLKIVIAILNVTSLAVTLLFPSPRTPLILVPTIISSMCWAINSQKEDIPWRVQRSVNFYTVMAVILLGICILLGSSTTVIKPESLDHYIVTISEDSAWLPNFSFNYLAFSFPIFFAVSFLISSEAVATYYIKKSNLTTKEKSINEQIEQDILVHSRKGE